MRLPSPSYIGQRKYFRWKVVERCSLLLEWTQYTQRPSYATTIRRTRTLFHINIHLFSSTWKWFWPGNDCGRWFDAIKVKNSSKVREYLMRFLRYSFSIYDSMAPSNANKIQKLNIFFIRIEAEVSRCIIAVRTVNKWTLTLLELSLFASLLNKCYRLFAEKIHTRCE